MELTIAPISWDSAVAVILFIIAILPSAVPLAVRKYRMRALFWPEYQPSQVAHALEWATDAKSEQQRLQITLRLALETHVEFIAIRFEGAGTLPTIGGLDDWQWAGNGKAPSISAYPVPGAGDGRWYWHYTTPNHRFRNARITIGMDYLATGYFDGNLVFEMTTSHGKKDQRLPFTVRKRAGQ